MSDTTEMETVTPTEQVNTAEQGAEVATSNSTEETTEQTQETQQEGEQQPEAKKREHWAQKRINEQTRKVYEAKREAEALRQRLAQYEQSQRQAPDEQQEQSQYQPQDLETLAEQKAAQLLAERSFNEKCNQVYEAGAKEVPNFDAAVSNLQLVGVNRDFLEAVTATDAGHKILAHLGQLENLPEAERILNLPPVQMGRELAKLELKLNQPPPPKPVSKAPAPISPIGSGGVTDSGLSDELPIDEWMRRHAKRK
jgi:hypothetical protein